MLFSSSYDFLHYLASTDGGVDVDAGDWEDNPCPEVNVWHPAKAKNPQAFEKLQSRLFDFMVNSNLAFEEGSLSLAVVPLEDDELSISFNCSIEEADVFSPTIIFSDVLSSAGFSGYNRETLEAAVEFKINILMDNYRLKRFETSVMIGSDAKDVLSKEDYTLAESAIDELNATFAGKYMEALYRLRNHYEAYTDFRLKARTKYCDCIGALRVCDYGEAWYTAANLSVTDEAKSYLQDNIGYELIEDP